MKLLLSPSQLDAALHRGIWYLLIGLPVLVGAVAWGWGPVMGPMMAMMLGALCGVFSREWRKPGMWMLAAVSLLMIGPIYGFFVVVEWAASNESLSGLHTLDLAAATAIAAKLCRLLASVIVQNWRLEVEAPGTQTDQSLSRTKNMSADCADFADEEDDLGHGI